MGRDLFTAGYEGINIDTFISNLLAKNINCVLDVRALPLSRKPGFSKNKLADRLKDADIQNFRFHDLRHTAASYLLEGGASLAQIGEILGHRSAQTSKRYSHLSTKKKAALAERLLGDKL